MDVLSLTTDADITSEGQRLENTSLSALHKNIYKTFNHVQIKF